jgi:hypothetical protein
MTDDEVILDAMKWQERRGLLLALSEGTLEGLSAVPFGDVMRNVFRVAGKEVTDWVMVAVTAAILRDRAARGDETVIPDWGLK